MNKDEILKIFEQTDALLSGHFLLTSGLHSNKYFQCAKVLQFPELAEKLCSQIARHFENHQITTVIAPAVGGIIVAHETAKALKSKAIFAERENNRMTLRRGFEIKDRENVLVVEDVITTGGSVQEIVKLVQEVGANPVGVGCLVDRSAGKADFGTPLYALLTLEVQTFSPEKCQLCQEGLQLVKPGSRKFTKNG